jgi:regulator of sigma E protease
VWPSGAASEAGLKKGDVIVRINGKEIHSTSDVIDKVQTGKKLVMEIVRGSRWMTITVQPEPLD